MDLSRQEKAKLATRGYQVDSPVLLGHGNYGAVYRVTVNQHVCVVKLIQMEVCMSGEIEMELYMISKIKHPHVVQLLDIFVGHKLMLIFMELLQGGDLKGYMRELKHWLTEPQATQYYLQFGDAFRYMHSRGYAHLDIKPDNILLDKSQQLCKVTDFSMSMVAYDQQTGAPRRSTNVLGIKVYQAPEVLDYSLDSYCPFKADVWSAGVILYEMLNACCPFELRNRRDNPKHLDFDFLHYQQVHQDYRFVNKNLSQSACRAIRVHLEPVPEYRPTFEQILLNEPLFNEGDCTDSDVMS